jgi:hypothetical protein
LWKYGKITGKKDYKLERNQEGTSQVVLQSSNPSCARINQDKSVNLS